MANPTKEQEAFYAGALAMREAAARLVRSRADTAAGTAREKLAEDGPPERALLPTIAATALSAAVQAVRDLPLEPLFVDWERGGRR